MKPLIAIDIDDVIAYTTEAVCRWANELTGKNLTLDDYRVETDADYWHYYESVWEKNGMQGLDLLKYLSDFGYDPERIKMVPGSKQALVDLAKDFDIIFVTSRDIRTREITQKWFKDQIGYEVRVHFASAGHHDYGKNAPSKGQIAKSLGAEYLIDDNPEHVQSALDHGVKAILFGDYGWQIRAPKDMIRIKTWPEAVEYINGSGQ